MFDAADAGRPGSQPSQAQTAEVGRRGAGQQDGPRRLEADGHRSALRRQIRAAALASAT